jgi:hypothetical protein
MTRVKLKSSRQTCLFYFEIRAPVSFSLLPLSYYTLFDTDIDVVMSIPAQVSIVWFAPGERTLATAILVLAGNMGSGVAFLFGMIVKQDDQFMNLVYLEAIVIMFVGTCNFPKRK